MMRGGVTNRGITTPARRPAPPTPGGVTPARLARRQQNFSSDTSSSSSSTEMDQVAVYCRLRPCDANNEFPCVNVVDQKSVQLIPPESSRAFLSGKQMSYKFRKVFGEESSQAEVFKRVAKPLVADLMHGRNGLLLTYGVTGSGKTYTMQGDGDDAGVMARAIKVIFDSVGERLVSRRYIIIPDRCNDFEVQGVADAALAEQNDIIKGRQAARTNYFTRSNSSNENINLPSDVESKIVDVDQNMAYAMFISYCEIYNTYIYDLLEDTRDPVTGRPKYETKFLREDNYGNMYVMGCTEIEVRSPKEALEAFSKGQKRRRVAQTQLNMESSRSHAIFNIRLVKAHPAGDGEVDLTKPCVVSQLALVDLAGSERTNRTGNTGQALKEAGRINNSLMNLRRCIERLRENQKSGKKGAVPYRDDKLTHLFRNYFEGIGCVRMVVCVNPRAQDFDENVNVMQFAEMAAEVQIDRIDPIPRELGMTAGQRRAQEAIKEALSRVRSVEGTTGSIDSNFRPIYSLGPEWPDVDMKVDEEDNNEILTKLIPFLERRITTKNTLIDDFGKKEELFRSRLVDVEKEIILLREENLRLKGMSENDKRRIRDLEARLVNAETANSSLQRRVHAFNDAKATLEIELDEKELLLNQQKKEQKRVSKKFRQHIENMETVNVELAQKLQRKEAEREFEFSEAAKLRAVRTIVGEKSPSKCAVSHPANLLDRSTSETRLKNWGIPLPGLVPVKSDPSLESATPRGRKSVAVSNPRHRRSQSAGDMWLNHQPAPKVPLNTIMQPEIKRQRSVTKLSEKDLDKASKYCLTTQQQDENGGLETRLYKGDVIPTAMGGRQVVFDDVEVLKQESPEKTPPGMATRRSKRSFEEFRGVSNRIAALESKLVSGNHGVNSAFSTKRSRI